jgi:hypothetical protein
MIGYEFDVEDGRAQVTGYAPTPGYVLIRVTSRDGSVYSSLRVTSQVQRSMDLEGGTHGNA